MTELFASPLAWRAVIGEAALQATLGILVLLATCALIPRMPGTARSWLWRLAFGRVVLALFWSAPLALPVLPPVREPVLRVAPPGSEFQPVTPERTLELPPERRLPWNAEWVLSVGWLAGAAWCLLHGVRQVGHARRLLRQSRPVTDPKLLDCWDDLLNTFELWRAPDLRESDEVDSPVLLQVARPTVILPTGLLNDWTVAQIRLMLAHELAHVRRRDLLWGWLPAVTHALLFFHPLVWIGSREWRLAHDSAADELALRITGAPAAEYARLLVRLAGGRRSAAAGLALMDARDSARTLERRLKLMSSRKSAPWAGGASWLAPLLLLGLAIAVPVRVTAQAPNVTSELTQPKVLLGLSRNSSSAPVVQLSRGPAVPATAARPTVGKNAADTPERRRLRETEQQLHALKQELDQVVRRNRELEERQRRLDQEVQALRGQALGKSPVTLDATLVEGLSELQKHALARRNQEQVARLRALVELERAERALREAQNAAQQPPVPVAPNKSTLYYTLRLLREEDAALTILAVVNISAPEGKWVTIQLPSGKVVIQNEAAAVADASRLVRVRAARDGRRMVVQIDWPSGGVEEIKVSRQGEVVRFASDKDHLAQLGSQSPHLIEVSVQPESGR